MRNTYVWLTAVVCLSASLASAQVGGSGTANSIPIWTDSKTLGNSILFQTPTGLVGIGTNKPSAMLHVTASSNNGQIILGRNLSTSQNGSPLGVVGISNGPFGVGVYGDAAATSGSNIGTAGLTASPDGIGVEGINDAASGNNSSGVAVVAACRVVDAFY